MGLLRLGGNRVIGGIAPLRTMPTFLGAHEGPDEFLGRRDEYLKVVIEEMLPRVAGMARFCDVFCEAAVFSVEDARRVLTAARGFGLRARMHVDQLSNSGGARLAAELEAVRRIIWNLRIRRGLRLWGGRAFNPCCCRG